jgi:hypothetical protein
MGRAPAAAGQPPAGPPLPPPLGINAYVEHANRNDFVPYVEKKSLGCRPFDVSFNAPALKLREGQLFKGIGPVRAGDPQ